MPDETINSYEKRFMKQIAAQNRAVSAMFDEFSKGVTPLLARYKKPPIVTDVWLMNKEIESAINSELRTLQRRMSEFMKSEAAAAWNLSADKSDAMVNGYIKDLAVSDIAKEGLFNRNLEALKEFQSRTVNGLSLSDRVWKVCEQSKEQLELYMQSGLATGRSAANIAGDVKKYLKNPDARFRRVRDESGKLVLSKPMKDYHPGQGVYRSAYKNALRMTRTETNAAYRSADMERWKKIDFVKGYEVKLSNNHPAVDICDYLKGEYPKTFFFDGWHPNCYCYCVPVLPSQDDFVTYLNNDKLPGSPIKGIPPSAVKYIKDRSASFAGMKNKPFWLKNNFVSRNGVYYPKAGVDKPPKISGVIRENPVTIPNVPIVNKPAFTPAKNIKEAESFGSKLFSEANYKGLNLDGINLIHERFIELDSKYKNIGLNYIGNYPRYMEKFNVSRKQKLAMGYSDKNKSIIMNPKSTKLGAYTDAIDYYAKTHSLKATEQTLKMMRAPDEVVNLFGQKAQRIQTVSRNPKDVFTHEIGHNIQDNLTDELSSELYSILNEERKKGYTYLLSDDAWTNNKEFFAESFAAYNIPEMRKFVSPKISEFITKYLLK